MAPAPTVPSPAPAEDVDEAAAIARERRTMLVAGAVFLGFLVALIAMAVVLAGDDGGSTVTTSSTTIACDEGDAACLAAQRSEGRPGIIPRPGEGREPEEAGDRGGALQGAVLGGVVVGVAVIIALAARSARRSRRTPIPSDGPVTRG